MYMLMYGLTYEGGKEEGDERERKGEKEKEEMMFIPTRRQNIS